MSVEEPAGGSNTSEVWQRFQMGSESFGGVSAMNPGPNAYAGLATEGNMPVVALVPSTIDTVAWSNAAAQHRNEPLYTGFSFFLFFLLRNWLNRIFIV